MIKQIISGCFIMTGVSMSALAAQTPLSPEQQNVIATQCQAILTQYPSLDSMTPADAKTAAPILTACYQNNSCQNAILSGVDSCAKKLALWNAKYTAPKIPQTITLEKPIAPPSPPAHPFNFNPTKPGPTPPVAPIQAPPTLVAPSEPTVQPQPTQQPAAQPNQPAKSNINWF